MQTAVVPPPAPRQTKADRTREALRQAALRHFVEDGFERASVPAIAAEVGVTERTFYRHFATKHEVLFVDIDHGMPWFPASIRAHLDAGASLADALLETLRTQPSDARLIVELARLRRELLSREQIDRAFQLGQGVMVAQLRLALSERGDDALQAAVRAQVAAGAVFAALGLWTEQCDDEPRLEQLLALTAEALDAVRPAL